MDPLSTLYVCMTAAITAVLTIFFLLIGRGIALKAGFVDQPETGFGARKRHPAAVPPIGGLAIVPVAAAASIFLYLYGPASGGINDIISASFWAMPAALLLMFLTGVIDDAFHLPSLIRLPLQITAAFLIVVPGGAELERLGNLLGAGAVEFGSFSLIFSVFCVVLLMNAYNMIDGLDGLSSGTAIILLSGISLFCIIRGEASCLLLTAPLIGALTGFFLLNMRFPWQRNALVFLGDAGALAIGSYLAWLSISLYRLPELEIPSMALGWLLAFPVMDTFGLFTYRLFHRRSPLSPDRAHFHHILVDSGLSVPVSVLIILMINVVYLGVGLICLLYVAIPEWVFFIPWIALLAVHTIVIFKAKSAADQTGRSGRSD